MSRSVFIIMALFAASPFVMGAEFIRAESFVLSERETLDADTWILAESILLAGEALDDVFLCATADSQKDTDKDVVFLSGSFQRDVWALGRTITLSGPVEGHARLAARRITLTDRVGRSVILLGNTVELSETSVLEAGGILIGENLFAGGHVLDKLTLKGSKVTLSGKFAGDVHVSAADIAVLPHTEIQGDLTYRSGDELFLDRSVVVGGVVREAISEQVKEERGFFSRPSVLLQIWLFSGALLAGLIFASLFPTFTERSAARARNSFWLCALIGMAAFCVIPIIAVFAMASIVGIPLGVLLLLTVFLLTYLSKIVMAMTISALLIRLSWRGSFVRLFFALFTGLFLLYVGVNAGLAGLVVWSVSTFTGIGAMLITLFSPSISVATSAVE